MDVQHKTLGISGVQVTFPFEPYDIQRRYMENVIKALQTGQNALLESPTGTGKTLSLLCSSLAWQQSNAPVGTKIYYTSRTHIQLNQAAKEMKRTAYARVPSVVMAGRAHLCLNDDVKSHGEGSIGRACQNATKRRACSYYTNLEQKVNTSFCADQVNDIEDLTHFGRTHECCPYYTSKKIAEQHASVVFMPYNYMIDLAIQKSVQLKIDKSVIIFDEGHNIESALKDSASGHFNDKYLKTIQDSCRDLPSKLSQVLTQTLHGLSRTGFDPTEKKSKKPAKEGEENKVNPIEELAEKLTNDKLQLVNKCAETLKSFKELLRYTKTYESTKISIKSLYGKFKESGVEFSTSDGLMETLDSMSTFWSIAGVMRPELIARYIGAIENLSKFISLMFPPGFSNMVKFDKHINNLESFYCAYLEAEFLEDKSRVVEGKKFTGWTMHIWCLHPKLGLDRIFDSTSIMGPRSLIITSGTLAPMNLMEQQLGREFKYKGEYEHLIGPKQFKISLLAKSPTGYSLNSTHEETKKPNYHIEMGRTLLSLFQTLPFGTLVFFPSYSLMNRVTNYLERNCRKLWDELCQATKIIKEPKEQSKFCDEMINFKRTIDKGGRAAFIAVCRGKLSEGTNLEANHCRNVIMIGLPFPNYTDPKIQATRDLHKKQGDTLNTWYDLQMKRALGQSIGRVIRSRDDFGMLFLCDPRFAQYNMSLSKWIHPFYPKYPVDDYRQLYRDIQEFYENYNIDISANSASSSSSSSQSSAFEIEQSHSRTVSAARVSPLRVNTAAVSRNNVCDSDAAKKDGNDLEIPIIDRRERLLKTYTVDRETFDRVKGNRRPVQPETVDKIPESKKPRKTCTDIFESLFSQQEHTQGDTTNNASDSRPPIAVINLDDEPSPEIHEATGNGDANTEPAPADETVDVAQDSRPEPAPKSSQAIAALKSKPDMCYICKNKAVRPNVINCPCARVGCKTCLKGLNNKECGVCKTKLKVSKFKPKLFNPFQKPEV